MSMRLYGRFLCDEDCDLEDMMDNIKYDMEEALKAIEVCEKNPNGTDWNTRDLKTDIKRFMEDWM